MKEVKVPVRKKAKTAANQKANGESNTSSFGFQPSPAFLAALKAVSALATSKKKKH